MLILTRVKMIAPSSTYIKIAPRSELAAKEIDVYARVVNCNYIGEVKVLLFNNTDKIL